MEVENVFVKIIMFLFIVIIIYLIYNFFNNLYLNDNKKCDLEKFNIDDLMIIERTPEYSKLINNIIDDKSFIFSDKELKVLKNPQQIFKLSNNDIKNISSIVYNDCNDELKSNTFDFDSKSNTNVNLIEQSDQTYLNIKNKLKNDIEKFIGPNYQNLNVIANTPLINNYLNNYYQDIYGNKINASLEDYFVAYYTLMNQPDDVGFGVNTLIGESNFIIPDQYNYDGKLTNAYNIDWDRIINPLTYS